MVENENIKSEAQKYLGKGWKWWIIVNTALVVVTWIILLFTLAGVGSLHEEMGNCPEIKSKRESPDEKNEGFEGPMSPQFAKSYSSSPIIDVRRSGKSQEVGGGEWDYFRNEDDKSETSNKSI